MDERRLGNSGMTTPPLVLGGNVFGWTADEGTSHAILDAFIDGGGRMVDTADVYSAFAPGLKGGESERVIGSWIKSRGNRDRVLIATKVGWEWSHGKGLRADYIACSVEQSLKRLQTDHIDIYYAHADDPETPLEETLEAFDRLKRAGMVRAIAASNYSAERLTEALDLSASRDLAAYAVVQPLYNLMDRKGFEEGLQELCLKRDLAALPYFGLASGFLTGKYRSAADLEGRPRGPYLQGYMNARGQRVLAALDKVAAETGAVPAQVALAWTAAQPGVAAPIASATSLAQMEELLGAMRLTLTAEQLDHLDAASRETDNA